MIVKGLMMLFLSVFGDITNGLDLPDLPGEVAGVMDTAASYLTAGVGILSNYTHLSYLLILFGVCVAVDVAVMLYKVGMWILRKLPFFGIT